MEYNNGFKTDSYETNPNGTDPYRQNFNGADPYGQSPYGQNPYGQTYGETDPGTGKTGGSGLAIASLVLGIIGFVFVCCIFPISFVMGIIGLILGIVSIVKQHDGKGMAIGGIILNALSVLTAAFLLISVFWLGSNGDVITEEVMNELENIAEEEINYSVPGGADAYELPADQTL